MVIILARHCIKKGKVKPRKTCVKSNCIFTLLGESCKTRKNKISPTVCAKKSLHHCAGRPIGKNPLIKVGSRLKRNMPLHGQASLIMEYRFFSKRPWYRTLQRPKFIVPVIIGWTRHKIAANFSRRIKNNPIMPCLQGLYANKLLLKFLKIGLKPSKNRHSTILGFV